MCISANWWEEFFEKNGKCKSDRHWLTKCTKRYDGKLRYRALAMIQRECRRVSHNTEKERKISLILTLKSQKFWVSDLGFSKNFSPQRIECSEARGTARAKRIAPLDSSQGEGVILRNNCPKSPSIDWPPQTTTFQNPFFHEALSKTKISKKPA